MKNYVDQEEKELIESLYSEEWEPNPDEVVNKVYEDYARKSIKFKNKLINSLKEVELMEEDIIEKNPIEEFLEELRNEKFN
jgi:hypothetical protein